MSDLVILTMMLLALLLLMLTSFGVLWLIWTNKFSIGLAKNNADAVVADAVVADAVVVPPPPSYSSSIGSSIGKPNSSKVCYMIYKKAY
jgi:hypothetical protein